MKLRIILFVLSSLSFVSIWTGGYLYYSSLKASAFEDAEKQAALQADSIKNHLSSFLGENLNSVRALAGLKELQQALSRKDVDSLRGPFDLHGHWGYVKKKGGLLQSPGIRRKGQYTDWRCCNQGGY